MSPDPPPDGPGPAPTSSDAAGTAPPDPSPEPAPDGPGAARSHLGWRIAGFVAVLAVAVLLAVVVITRDRDRQAAAGSRAATATTYALPPDNGGTPAPTSTSTTIDPAAPAPGTRPSGPRTAATVSQLLERALRERTGWTHKVACFPAGPVERGSVLSCGAATEPVIREIPPSQVLAVVVDDQGRFVWKQGTDEPLQPDALEPAGLTCGQLKERGFSWVAVLAYWEIHGRPTDLETDRDPTGDGRPCTVTYPNGPADAEATAL